MWVQFRTVIVRCTGDTIGILLRWYQGQVRMGVGFCGAEVEVQRHLHLAPNLVTGTVMPPIAVASRTLHRPHVAFQFNTGQMRDPQCASGTA